MFFQAVTNPKRGEYFQRYIRGESPLVAGVFPRESYNCKSVNFISSLTFIKLKCKLKFQLIINFS